MAAILSSAPPPVDHFHPDAQPSRKWGAAVARKILRKVQRQPTGFGLQTPSERQHEQNDEDDSSDSDSAVWAISVVAAATAKQQNQDQNQ
jgi:hypothetical protein